MVIGSAEKRLNIQLWIFALVIDVILAAAVAYFVNRDEWLSTTFWIWLAVQAAGVILGILGMIRLVLLNKAGAFRPAKIGMLRALEGANLPAPSSAYVLSVDDYLHDIVNDEAQSVQVRIAAASIHGARQGITKSSGWIKGIMIDSAHEEALKEYAPGKR